MNKTFKVVVGLVGAHLVLFTLLKLDQGGSAYAMGQSTGKLIWFAIIAFALMRRVKYGWGVSVFVMAAMLVREAIALLGTLEGAGAAGDVTTPWILFSIVNAPLILALILILRGKCRSSFRETRSPSSTTESGL